MVYVAVEEVALRDRGKKGRKEVEGKPKDEIGRPSPDSWGNASFCTPPQAPFHDEAVTTRCKLPKDSQLQLSTLKDAYLRPVGDSASAA